MNFSDLPQHHAILFVTPSRDIYSQQFFSELQLESPVHRFFNQTVLDIDTARSIIAWAQAPYNNQEKVAIVSFHSIGLEAQNTLLKVLEEPRQGGRFILITGNNSGLIDTVLSRVHSVFDSNHSNVFLDDAELFLSTTHTLRMKLPCISALLSRQDEEERKDREAVRNFILSLTTVLSKKKINSRYIQETISIASYASDPSASGKALLEYLSLLLPQV